MTFKEFWDREAYVAMHAQTMGFRVVKYIAIFVILGGVYAWKGLGAVGILLGAMFVCAIAIHFFFRYKTEAWTKSWGPYTKVLIDE